MVAETGSSNADLLAAAREGAREGLVLVAESQTAGRGRMGRRWTSPPRAGLTFSVLLRPYGVPASLLGWLPLLAGTAVAAAVPTVTTVAPRLKWPNDVLVGEAKLAGILAERSGSAVVIGIGINVTQRAPDLPERGTSLLLLDPAAAAADMRSRLLLAVLGALSGRYLTWREQFSPGDADACGLRQEYTSRCATLGRQVRAGLPAGKEVEGTANGIDWAGRLEIQTATNLVPVSAGDVVHVR